MFYQHISETHSRVLEKYEVLWVEVIWTLCTSECSQTHINHNWGLELS